MNDISMEITNAISQLSYSFNESITLNSKHTLDCALFYLENDKWPCENSEEQKELCVDKLQSMPSCNYRKLM